MTLWIDTGWLERGQALFGLPPLERLRRSVRSLANVQVVLSGRDLPASTWPGARIDDGTGGGIGSDGAVVGAAALGARTDPDSGHVLDAGGRRASGTDGDRAPGSDRDLGADSGRSPGARLRRALIDTKGTLVAIDSADAIDPRLLQFLLRDGPPSVAARGDGAQRAVALRLDPSLADAIPLDATDLRTVADALVAARRIAPLDDRDFPAFVDKLRRSLPYWLYAVPDAAARRTLERRLFWANYKGSTDFLTRWVYPPLVWPLVLLCTRLGIHPNVVTVLSVVLAFAAVPLFARGDFLAGFACAYAMSILDSVDGKVARLTLTDSKLGNALDHGTDIVHPPFWYFAWAWGLGAHDAADPLYRAALWLIAFYVADRLVLGVARRRLGFALHAASRLDGAVRSVIARRNVTMTIMATALLLGVGPAGLYAVTAWQGLTFAWHAWRTVRLGFRPREQARPEVR